MKSEKIPLQIFENCGRETWYQFSLALLVFITFICWQVNWKVRDVRTFLDVQQHFSWNTTLLTDRNSPIIYMYVATIFYCVYHTFPLTWSVGLSWWRSSLVACQDEMAWSRTCETHFRNTAFRSAFIYMNSLKHSTTYHNQVLTAIKP
jgi:hypothetical protein